MTTNTFHSNTSLNGKYQVMSTQNISMPGVIKISSNKITTQKGILYKSLNNYWVTGEALLVIKETYDSKSAYF